jgi:hypothetical protein
MIKPSNILNKIPNIIGILMIAIPLLYFLYNAVCKLLNDPPIPFTAWLAGIGMLFIGWLYVFVAIKLIERKPKT